MDGRARPDEWRESPIEFNVVFTVKVSSEILQAFVCFGIWVYPFFEIMEREAYDNRNFVKKAVNWALRQIGKRNNELRMMALRTNGNIAKQDSASSKWMSKHAIMELSKF